MGVIQHNFLGAMDLDSQPTEIPAGFNMGTWNSVWRGVPGRMRLESVPGTIARVNPYLPTGMNKCINCSYDAVNQRIFDFNWNSIGNHGIYIYYTQTNTWKILIQTGINTVGDPLAFTPDRISSVDIIYADNNNGDLLFFVDSLKRPRKLNIDRLLSGSYTGVQDDYLKVIKAPPIIPPKVVYENDFTVTINDCVNSTFEICYTYIYDDFEESVFASGCAMALPSDPFDPANNVPQTRNCRIRVYLQTGDQNVVKIKIYAKQTKDGATTGWFIVETLIKADLSIPDNGVYQYLFYNNGSYVPCDPKLALLLYDYVPQFANCQALLNGTTISYAGLTEGYDYVKPKLNLSIINKTSPDYTINGTLLCAYNNGSFSGSQPLITVFLTGVGANDGFGNPIDLEKGPVTLFVRAKSNASDISFSYNNAGGNRNIATLLFNLRGAATSAGWTFVSSSTNSITIFYPTGNVVLQAAGTNGVSSDVSLYKSPRFSFYPESSYQFGVVYYDKDGRTNGVISDVSGKIKMPVYNYVVNQIPEVTVDLSNMTPPAWAVYYHLVRTDTLTYNKHLYWVTNQAFQNVGQNGATKFAYFGITNMSDYNIQISSTKNVVSYEYTPGDRVRVLGRYAVDGTFTPLNYDYAVIGLNPAPILNGVTQEGSFVQIYYPDADINPNFKFDGTDNFENYEILLYSYKGYSPDNQNVFFEIGQEYGIGNPGTPSAYHMGNAGDSLIKLTDGDIFYRERSVPTGNTYLIETIGFDMRTEYSLLNTSSFDTVTNSIYEIKGGLNSAATPMGGPDALTSSPTYAYNNNYIWNKSPNPLSVRIRGTIPVTDTHDPNGSFGMYVKILDPSSTRTGLPVLLAPKNGLGVGVQNNYTFDATISIPPNNKAFILNYAVNEMTIGSFELRLDIVRNTTIQIFESSFSDTYSIITNSDNRPNVIDITAKKTYYSTLFRYSLSYQPGTSINNTNRFYPSNFDEFMKSHGDVRRMIPREKEVDVFQDRKCGHFAVYGRYVQNNQGATELLATDVIITPNNIQYYVGDFGVGNQPDCIAISGYQRFFCDPVKGFICRLSLNGVEPISEIFKVQTWAGNNITNYLQQYNYQFGGKPVILGVFNFTKDRDGEAIFVLQPGTTSAVSYPGPSSTTITQPAISGGTGPATLIGQSIAFNDRKNCFSSFYDFAPDSITCAENKLYSFYNGVLYSHDNQTTYCNFYGTQYVPKITIPYNDLSSERKTFTSLFQTANVQWNAPLIYTDSNTYGTQRQQSKLIDQNFEQLEGNFYTSFLRDILSQKGWINGDYLKGNLMIIQLQVTNGGNFSYLASCNVNYLDSPLNK